MLALHDLQTSFARAILGAHEPALLSAIHGDGLTPQARVQIYGHHVFTSLTAALKATYPVVCRLVDERFFDYAADGFIREHLPAGPCLFEYGTAFPDFLAAFPACAGLPYLPDVARLEWAMDRALHADDAAPVDAARLQAVAETDPAGLTLTVHPAFALLRSAWPVDAIWRANQPDANPDASVDLGAGAVCLEVWRRDDDVLFRRLSPALFSFRSALKDERRLAVAVEAALANDPRFDLALALAELMTDGLIVGAGTAAPLDHLDAR